MQTLTTDDFTLVRNLDNEVNYHASTGKGDFVFGTLEYVNQYIQSCTQKGIELTIQHFMYDLNKHYAVLLG